MLKGKDLQSPRVAKLEDAVALDATGSNAVRVRTPARGPTHCTRSIGLRRVSRFPSVAFSAASVLSESVIFRLL